MEVKEPGQKGLLKGINKHALLMILGCLAPIIIIFILLALGIRNAYLSFAVTLICPLSMVLMMAFMFKGAKNKGEHIH